MLKITAGILIIATLILLYFMVKARSVWEKLIGLNLVIIKIMMLITVYAILMDSKYVLDISMTYSIIGFVSVVLLSRFLLKGGRLK